METIINIILFFTGVLFYFLATCFVIGDMKVFEWETPWRFMLVSNATVFGWAAIALYNINKKA